MIFGAVRKMPATGALAWMLAATLLSCATTSTGPAPLPQLEKGSQRGELAGGEVREFALPASREMFVHLFVDAAEMDLEAVVVDEEDRIVAHAELAPHGELRRVLVTTLPAQGRFRLRLSSPDPASFRLVIYELYPATPLDVVRAPALHDLYRARTLFVAGLPRDHYLAAVKLVRRAEDRLAEVDPAYGAYAKLQEANCWLYLQDNHRTLEAARESRQRFEALRQGDGAWDSGLETSYPRWLAEAYGTEAGALNELGRSADALPLHGKAIQIYLQIGRRGHLGAAINLNNRGNALADLGRTEEAERDFLQALEIVDREERHHHRAVTYLVNLADLYRREGRLQEALGRFRQARARAASDPQVAVSTRLHIQSTLGRFYIAIGDYKEAERLLNDALALARNQKNRQFETSILRNLGLLQRVLGKLDAAETAYLEALQVARELTSRPVIAGILLDLGVIQRERGDLQGAQDSVEEAARLADLDGLPASRVRSLRDEARLETLRGNASEALKLSEQAVILARKAAPNLVSQALLTHGEALLASGSSSAARRTFHEALAEVPDEGLPIHRVEILSALGRAARVEGDLVRSQDELWRAVRILEQVRGNLETPGARTDFFAHHHHLYVLLIDVLAELHQLDPGGQWAVRALEVSERSRARTLMEMISGAPTLAHTTTDADLRRRERSQFEALSLFQDHLASKVWEENEATTDETQRSLQVGLAEVRKAYRETEKEIQRRHPEFAEIRYPQPLAPAEMAELLLPEQALVQFALGPHRSWALILRSGNVSVRQLPPASEITEKVKKIRRTLERADVVSTRRVREYGRTLYGTLLASAEPLLREADRLYIVPDGVLHLLPFELLSDPGGRYAIETWEIAYVPSASVLARLRSRVASPRSASFVAFADPIPYQEGDHRGSASPDPSPGSAEPWRALPGTAEEVTSIARLFPESARLYLGAQANEDNLFGSEPVAGTRWLHFASHGVIVEDDPLASAILMSPNAQGDRFLEASEIFDLDLTAELVVLSACETGLGPTIRGEGIIGLSRAFFFAGSENVLVSLWRIQDRSTSRFMTELYQRLADGQTPVAALRQVKLQWISRGMTPQAWAPFVSLGPS